MSEPVLQLPLRRYERLRLGLTALIDQTADIDTGDNELAEIATEDEVNEWKLLRDELDAAVPVHYRNKILGIQHS